MEMIQENFSIWEDGLNKMEIEPSSLLIDQV